jgi:hypothetical protein
MLIEQRKMYNGILLKTLRYKILEYMYVSEPFISDRIASKVSRCECLNFPSHVVVQPVDWLLQPAP